MTNILATYYAAIQDMPENEYKVEILKDGPIKQVSINGTIYDVDYNIGGDTIHSVIINNRSYGVQISASSPSSYEIHHKGESFQIEIKSELDKTHSQDGGTSTGRQVIVAPMPGVILKTYVKEGDEVKKGDPLCVLVAMKMENEILATIDGTVQNIFVKENSKVALNEKIMVLE